MPKTFVDGKEVKTWFVDGRQVKKAYLDGRLIYQDEFILYITTTNHDVTDDWVWSQVQAGGGASAGKVQIIVNPGVQLISAVSTVRGVFNFNGPWAGKEVLITNNGFIAGRGGAGGAGPGGGGVSGGRAIYNENARLTIINNGVISGGGGGGGGERSYAVSGGGGAPFGAGGYSGSVQVAWRGQAAGFDAPGAGGVRRAGSNYGGSGGGWAAPGGSSYTDGRPGLGGGAAGEATRGAITWAVVGDIRGVRA